MEVVSINTQNMKETKVWCWAELSQNGWEWDLGCLHLGIKHFLLPNGVNRKLMNDVIGIEQHVLQTGHVT